MAIDPFLSNIAVVLFSLAIIMKAADNIVDAISDYAKKLGLSDYIIGLVVVAFAASMPELISALTGLVIGREEVLMGTILGTNMVHMTLVLGVLAVIGKRLNVEIKVLDKSLFLLYFVLAIPFALILVDGRLGRFDGIFLLLLFIAYLVWLWYQEGTFGKIKKDVKVKKIWKDVFIFIGSLAAILLAGRWLVFSAVNISGLLGIPAFFIAITVIAIGGAIPDFAVGLKSVLKGHQAIGVGDIVGSIVLEFLLFFGLVGLIHPITINRAEIMGTVVFLFVSLAYLFHIIKGKVMIRRHGFVMLGLYALFLAFEVSKLL